MKILQPLLICLLSISWVHGQYCTNDNRFTELPFFDLNELIETPEVIYGNAEDRFGVPQDLIMDVFQPNPSIDSLTERPFILLIHPGGFLGGTKDIMRDLCILLAQRGFVTATISYRLGFETGNPDDQRLAIYRAQQDARAALRFLVENAIDYGIDTDALFIGGRSAGAVTSLNTVYITQDEWNTDVPGIETLLGGIDNSGNTLTNTFELRGIFNNWGATFNGVVNANEMLPIIGFHGAMDPTLPIDQDPITGFIGSRFIHDLLIDEGICSSLTVDPEGGHGIYLDEAGKEFRASTAACFFKSIFCESCSSVYTEVPIKPNCSETLTITDIKLANSHVVPNPFTDKIRLEGNLDAVTYTLYNASGKFIYQGTAIEEEYFGYLSKGIYFLKLTKGQSFTYIKLLKN